MRCLVSPWHCLREGTGLKDECEDDIRQRQTQKVAQSGKNRRTHLQQVGRGYRGLSIISLKLRKDLMKQNNQSTVSLDVCNLHVPSLPFNCSSENCELGRKWK